MEKGGREARVERIEPRYLGLGELFFRMRDAVIVGDAGTGRVVLWNDAASALFGYSEAEATDLIIEDLVPDSLKEAHRRGLQRFAESGHGSLVDSASVVELPALRKDGSQVFVELSLTPLESPGLPSRYALAIVRDVTERKDSLDRLRKLDELRNLLVATVAHDIRSPMAAVVGFAEILQTGWETIKESDRRRALDGIARSAATVGRLVDDVLLVATLQSGEVPYLLEDVDLARAVSETLEEIRVANPSLVFESRVPSSIPRLRADSARLWQVLTNLLANAARHSTEGGHIEVSALTDGEMVEISVIDHGPGIAEQDQAGLFEPFSRVGNEDEPRIRGTGLGLYICDMIVRAHGGTIWVESTPAAGAAYRFTNPTAIE